MIWYSSIFAKKIKRKKTIVVDFDDTIADDAYPEIGKLKPGVKDAFENLKDHGFEIVIFTCRLTRDPQKSKKEIDRQRKIIKEFLEDNEIPYDRIDEGENGKPHALFFVDDKAIEFGGKNDWESISAYIISREG